MEKRNCDLMITRILHFHDCQGKRDCISYDMPETLTRKVTRDHPSIKYRLPYPTQNIFKSRYTQKCILHNPVPAENTLKFALQPREHSANLHNNPVHPVVVSSSSKQLAIRDDMAAGFKS